MALIGLGLIASSITHAIRRTGAPVRITGYARTAETRARGGAPRPRRDLRQRRRRRSAGADLVILCVPVGAMGEVAAEIAPHLEPGATVTDVGSVKGAVIAAVGPHMPEGVHFIPGHPLAGTEHSGPASGFAVALRQPLVPADAAARRPTLPRSRISPASGPRSAPGWT